jgi:hypothetical protein
MIKRFPHFIFGYGSLICPDYRAITTAPTLENRTATPVVAVQNVERTWTKRSVKGFTAMGVRFTEGAECVSILLSVNDQARAHTIR